MSDIVKTKNDAMKAFTVMVLVGMMLISLTACKTELEKVEESITALESTIEFAESNVRMHRLELERLKATRGIVMRQEFLSLTSAGLPEDIARKEAVESFKSDYESELYLAKSEIEWLKELKNNLQNAKAERSRLLANKSTTN